MPKNQTFFQWPRTVSLSSRQKNRPLVSYVRNFDLEKVKNILVDAAKVDPDLMFTLDNAQGDQLVRSNDEDLVNVAQREFFKQAMNGNEAYVSDVIVTLTNNELIVVIATPVRDMNNNIIGVLQANVYLDQLSDFVTELQKTVQMYIFFQGKELY